MPRTVPLLSATGIVSLIPASSSVPFPSTVSAPLPSAPASLIDTVALPLIKVVPLRVLAALSAILPGPATVSGAGTVSIPFANANYTGTWELDSGTLRIGNPLALGSLSTPINFAGGTFELNNISYGNNITVPDGGTLRGTGTSTFAGAITVAPSSSVTISSGVTGAETFTIGDASHHLTGGAGSTIHIIGGGRVDLPFDGSGYAGDFAVDAGILRVSVGTATSGGTSPIVINSGATLEINNVNWGRDLTMNDGSTLRGNAAQEKSSFAPDAESWRRL